MIEYTIQRGETCRFLVHTDVGTDITGYSIACEMRPFAGSVSIIDNDAAPTATLAETSFAGDSTRGPGWYLTLSATVTDALALGRYILDARYTLPNGEIEISEPWILVVNNRVTEAA